MQPVARLRARLPLPVVSPDLVLRLLPQPEVVLKGSAALGESGTRLGVRLSLPLGWEARPHAVSRAKLFAGPPWGAYREPIESLSRVCRWWGLRGEPWT